MQFIRNFKFFLIFLFSLLIASEFALRFRMVQKNCVEKKECNLKKIFSLKYESKESEPFFEILKYDKKLGFITKRNYKRAIIPPNKTKPVIISLDKRGLRISSKGIKNNSKKRILTIGGDIAFGNNVSDEDTWQSCLNKKQDKFIFHNAGVPHYGTGQSLLRLKKYIDLDLYDGVIVISEIWHDLRIDQHSYHYGYPVPRLTKKNNNLVFENKTINNLQGSRFNNEKPRSFLLFAANSELLHRIFSKFGNKINDPRHIVNSSISYIDKAYFTKKELSEWLVSETKNFNIPFYWIISGRSYSDASYNNLKMRRSEMLDILKKENIKYLDLVENVLKSSRKNNFKKQKQNYDSPMESIEICKSILNSNFLD